MIATIDKSGKLQIPKPIRQRFGITPQTRLNIEEFSGQIVIKIMPSVSQLVNKDGVLVFCGQCRTDLQEMLAQDRQERLTKLSFWEAK